MPWLSDAASDAPAPDGPVSLGKVVREDLPARPHPARRAPAGRADQRAGRGRTPGRLARAGARGAARELESSGLVVARKNAGVFVRELAPREVKDLYELRGVLDGFAGRRAASAEGPRRSLCRLLETAAGAMRKAARRGDVRLLHREPALPLEHRVQAAGNEKLTEAYRGLVRQLHLWRLRNLAQPVGMAASIAEHDDIARALREGDSPRSERLLAAHVSAARQRLDHYLEEEKT